VKSAGIEAHGVNRNAIQAVVEVGVNISNHTSDLIDFDTLNIATLAASLIISQVYCIWSRTCRHFGHECPDNFNSCYF